MRRAIRLKEWEPGVKKQMTPPANLIEESDGSLSSDPVSITVSDDGFLIDPRRPENFENRIIIMGDSIVECSFVPEGSRLTDVVERELRAKGISTRVENGGRSGATILQLLLSLQSKIIPMQPKKIILMNGVIDADALQLESGLWSKGDYFNPLEEAKSGHIVPRRVVEMDFSSRTKYLRLFADTCRLFEIELLIATLPLREIDSYMDRYFSKHGARNIRMEAVNKNTRDFCASNGVSLIDLDKLLGRNSACFYDYFHFNVNGADATGRILANHIFK